MALECVGDDYGCRACGLAGLESIVRFGAVVHAKVVRRAARVCGPWKTRDGTGLSGVRAHALTRDVRTKACFQKPNENHEYRMTEATNTNISLYTKGKDNCID